MLSKNEALVALHAAENCGCGGVCGMCRDTEILREAEAILGPRAIEALQGLRHGAPLSEWRQAVEVA